MSGGKETPRQKMIGMMYLVLTALLALNVAKSVLDAFILVDEGLTKTTENFAKKNSSYYDNFAAALQVNEKKVSDWKSKADEVQKRSNELYDLLYDCKKEIVIKSEGEDTKAIQDDEVYLKYVKGKDNNNIPAEIMIFNKRGIEVREAIADFRDFLLSLIDDKELYAPIVANIKSTLDTSDPEQDEESKGEKHSWESEHFEHLPLASVITILSKMQSDVRNAEADILAYLLSQIDAGSILFNKIDPIVLSTSDYVFRGQEYEAKVFLAAYDSTKAPEVILNDNTTKLPIEDGKGVYKITNNSIGSHKWGGTILVDQGNGNIIKRKFEAQYQVAEASAVVSPTKMNVFYRGVPNPVAISVSGVPEENIDATITKRTYFTFRRKLECITRSR
jgi:gliding motility-associated protein GldM